MWFEVEITATVTISVEADDKSAAEAKISSAIMMQDSELIDQLTECVDISAREIDEDEADMNYIYEE
jgi:hypothetical protein